MLINRSGSCQIGQAIILIKYHLHGLVSFHLIYIGTSMYVKVSKDPERLTNKLVRYRNHYNFTVYEVLLHLLKILCSEWLFALLDLCISVLQFAFENFESHYVKQ